MRDPLVRQVAQLIQSHELCVKGDTIVIGVSGGRDSVALTHALHTIATERQWCLVLAHVNYGLRGKASDADEQFVRKLAKTLKIPCRVKQCRYEARSTKHEAQNFQSWARNARYDFFLHVARQRNARAIAVAHHQEDQCETVLMNLIRGAGPAGLCGMSLRRPLAEGVDLIRPLLHCVRKDILAYIKRHRLVFRDDATNASEKYQRNRVRRRLIPLLSKLNAQAVAHICACAEMMQEETEALNTIANQQWRNAGGRRNTDDRIRNTDDGQRTTAVSCDRKALIALPTALRRRIFRSLYNDVAGTLHGLSRDHLLHMDAITHGKGQEYHLPGAIMFRREKHQLLLSRERSPVA